MNLLEHPSGRWIRIATEIGSERSTRSSSSSKEAPFVGCSRAKGNITFEESGPSDDIPLPLKQSKSESKQHDEDEFKSNKKEQFLRRDRPRERERKCK